MEGEETAPFSNRAWTISEHCEVYSQHVKGHQSVLQKLWDDLEIPSDEQMQQLVETANRAQDIWGEAVKSAERQQSSLRENIEEAHRRIAKIKAEMSDETFPDEDDSGVHPKSLKGQYDTAESSLQIWLKRRLQRQQKYEALKEKCKSLRIQMGLTGSSVPVKSITLFVLEGAELELKKLEAEVVERRHLLEIHLKELRKICLALGEDEVPHAVSVHPSLGHSRDASSSQQDLSDKTFDGLREKVLELQELARAREEQGERLLQMLQSLWDALEVAEDDVDRDLFARLFGGPSKLHQATIDKCSKEVARLESAREDLMLGIIKAKRQELANICASSHIQMPNLPETATQPGEVADLLARTLKQLTAIKAEAEQRSEVLSLIQTLGTALAEDEWLTLYENDPHKYKGRDSTRKIQKAIVAQEHRKQLPSMIENVEAALQSYSATLGRPFKYDGKDYQADVLVPLKLQLQQEEEQKVQVAKGRSLAGSARKPTKGPQTPKRLPKGIRGSSDGGFRKPALPVTPKTGGGIQRTASALSRADSNASRNESEPFGVDFLSERMSKLLHSVASPAVSRTVSGTSETDMERPVLTPEAKAYERAQSKSAYDGHFSNLFVGKLSQTADDAENKRNSLNTAPLDMNAASLGFTMAERSGSM